MKSIGDARIVFRQEDAAMHQLERSIALFIHERDYLCALTLAGAADGLLGEMLQASGRRPAIEDHVNLILSTEPNCASAKQLRDKTFNLTKNLLKHKKVSDQAELSIPLETQAVYMISRAIENSIRMRHELDGQRLLFIQWIYENRKDLIGD